MNFNCRDELILQTILFPRVIVEGGMHLSTLTRILESVHLTLDICGRVPDLTVCDAINAGKLFNKVLKY